MTRSAPSSRISVELRVLLAADPGLGRDAVGRLGAVDRAARHRVAGAEGEEDLRDARDERDDAARRRGERDDGARTARDELDQRGAGTCSRRVALGRSARRRPCAGRDRPVSMRRIAPRAPHSPQQRGAVLSRAQCVPLGYPPEGRAWSAPPISSIALSTAACSPACPSASRSPSASGGCAICPSIASPLFRRDDPRLAITLGGVRLPNPLILSSMYYDTAILRRAMGLGLRRRHRQEHHARAPRPGPSRSRTSCASARAEGPGLVNCNGFQNPGPRGLSPRPGRACPTACRSSWPRRASPPRSTSRVVAGLAPFGDLVEINISSPNTKLVYELVDAARRARRALSRRARGHRQADHREGVAGFSRHQRGDDDPGRARRGHHHRQLRQHAPRGRAARSRRARAGSRGPRCSRATLDNVRRLRAAVRRPSIEIIATGGIDAPDKARQALDAGATACAYFTGFITRGPHPGAADPRRARHRALGLG